MFTRHLGPISVAIQLPPTLMPQIFNPSAQYSCKYTDTVNSKCQMYIRIAKGKLKKSLASLCLSVVKIPPELLPLFPQPKDAWFHQHLSPLALSISQMLIESTRQLVAQHASKVFRVLRMSKANPQDVWFLLQYLPVSVKGFCWRHKCSTRLKHFFTNEIAHLTKRSNSAVACHVVKQRFSSL